MLMNGADALLRSLEAEGVETVFGIPGGAILPDVRRARARDDDPARARPPRAGRGPHGPGLRARLGPRRCRLRHLRAGGDEPGDADRGRLDGLDAARLRDRAGAVAPDRHRRLPGVRHHRASRSRSSSTRGSSRTWTSCRTRSRRRSTSPARGVAARSSSTSRATSRRRRSTSSYPDEIDLPGWRPAATVNTKQVRAAAQAIADAQRPVLYVGGGTINAEACDELRALAELWQLPVVTTLMAKSSFPETHELHFGWPGMHGAKWSNWAMNKCDVLVAVGARFDDRVTGKLSAFAPGATVVHLDVDAAEIGKLRRADIPVVGPLKQILAELADRVRGAEGRRASVHRPRPGSPSSPAGARSSRSATATTATCSSRSACSRRCRHRRAGATT